MKKQQYIYLTLLLCILTACRGLISVPPPANELPGEDVFANDTMADAAVSDLYYELSNYYTGNLLTVVNGLTADELNTLNTSTAYLGYLNNAILPGDEVILGSWQQFYKVIYEANAVLEELPVSSGVTTEKISQLIGEAKFIRAFCYFYLVNYWGDVPLITSTNLQNTALAIRSPVNAIYEQMVVDLTDAVRLLLENYPSGEKVRANKWAATALLARLYLEQGKWTDAEIQASNVISSGDYTLSAPENTFTRNSNSTLLQIWTPDGYTLLGQTFIPFTAGSYAFYPLTDNFMNAFESGDRRKQMWTASFSYANKTYYYPVKYKKRTATTGSDEEYLMALRLEEQYLIRAEARCREDDFAGALTDLNVIRDRAGLPALSGINDFTTCILAVAKERRMELFTEWGDRWITLRRSGRIDSIMTSVKPGWKHTAALYPIPQQERNRDPQLTQNPGYQ